MTFSMEIEKERRKKKNKKIVEIQETKENYHVRNETLIKRIIS